MWTCKHCNKEFAFERNTDRANHSRWCDNNPKVTYYKNSNKKQATETAERRFGKFKNFNVECETCKIEFMVEEREKLFPQKEKYFCNRSCANAMGGAAKALKYYPDDIAKYRTICKRYHKMECIICGFDKIVDVHHIDENHENNDPKNLIPLCGNHHNMFHSRFRNEIEYFITEYVKVRWK